MTDFLYRAEFDFYGDFYFRKIRVIRETEKTFFIRDCDKRRRVLKNQNNKRNKKSFARETKAEAFNDLFVRTQISKDMLERRLEYTKEKLEKIEKVLKDFDKENCKCAYEHEKIILNDENINKLEEVLNDKKRYMW